MALRVQTLLSCPCCDRYVDRFLPIPEAYVRQCEAMGVEHPLDAWETLNLEAYLCPHCGATDRDRLQVLFLNEHLNGLRKGLSRFNALTLQNLNTLSILEIAPSPPVSNWLRTRPNVAYRSADLEMSSADDKVDVTDMACYPDGSFDIVICSHVLEHVPDDLKAMREIRRILAPGGVAVLLVPISTLVEDVVEDPDCTDEAERWRRFGQGDHIRIYSQSGFEGRLSEVGLTLNRFSPEAGLASGLTSSSVLYLGSTI